MKAALSRMNPLAIALGASVLLHAVLLTVRFVDPEGFNRVFEDTPLEVILVNAKSDEAPEKAQAIAQSNLAGGGESTGMATSPLPPSAMDSYGNAELSLPNKIFDYLLAGLPVLSSSTGALKRLFDEWPVGPMYPPGDEPGLRAALADLIAHRERYVAAINARPDLLVKHGWEAQAVKLQQIYDRLPLARQRPLR